MPDESTDEITCVNAKRASVSGNTLPRLGESPERSDKVCFCLFCLTYVFYHLVIECGARGIFSKNRMCIFKFQVFIQSGCLHASMHIEVLQE